MRNLEGFFNNDTLLLFYPSDKILKIEDNGTDVKYIFPDDKYMLMKIINNRITYICYYYKHYVHRDRDKPTKLVYYGSIAHEIYYYKYNMIHRDGDKPALVAYNTSGYKCFEYYYKRGEYDRIDDKPQLIHFHSNGNIECETYFHSGRFHRDFDNPCMIKYDLEGNIIKRLFFENGKEIEYEEILKKKEKRKDILVNLNF